MLEQRRNRSAFQRDHSLVQRPAVPGIEGEHHSACAPALQAGAGEVGEPCVIADFALPLRGCAE